MADRRVSIYVEDLADGVAVLRGNQFRTDHPFRATRQLFGPTVLDVEGKDHSTRKRNWLQDFSRRALASESYRSIIQRSMAEGFADARDHDDLMRLAVYVPNRVILLLLRCEDIDPMKHHERVRPAIAYLETNVKGPGLAEAKAYLRSALFKRDNGLFGGLEPREREAELSLLAVAGSETTTVAMKALLAFWAEDHDGFVRECEDEGVDAFILRLLRRDPPLGLATRYCSGEARVGETTFQKGDIVHVDLVKSNGGCPMSNGSASSDLTFGQGKHSCPGHLLAKAELTLLTERLMAMNRADIVLERTAAAPRPANFRHPSGIALRFAGEARSVA
ncbi:hypothetical protein FP2506_15599 [Fulvimarina pelagi HTCC2506]|uniref:Cytochrome P450 n=1 Tax=Fulvimarina pelagi HTCC2506 TaxID=314231 RepID=Q0G3G0_9HYPH|nr:cytochrome P450 [Fulvimarina pelagi]EAU41871.1 hypothetical protein FP2506_15599 [Fulvimarina pelagi HTCC2506]